MSDDELSLAPWWRMLVGESFRNAGERRQVNTVVLVATYLQGLTERQARVACVGIASAAAAEWQRVRAEWEESTAAFGETPPAAAPDARDAVIAGLRAENAALAGRIEALNALTGRRVKTVTRVDDKVEKVVEESAPV
jgi:hypothetical protein